MLNGQCIVDISRFWDYPLIIKLCCTLPLPEIFECMLGVYCKLFVSPTTKETHPHKSSQVYGHLKLHFGMYQYVWYLFVLCVSLLDSRTQFIFMADAFVTAQGIATQCAAGW